MTPTKEAQIYYGVNNPDPIGAFKAKTCRCAEQGDEPWLSRDEDGDVRCQKCGKRPR